MQRKCWCKHALQSQWGGGSLGFVPAGLLAFHMQAAGWLCCWAVSSSGLTRPLVCKSSTGHLCLPTCLEAMTTILVTRSVCGTCSPLLCFPKLQEESGLQLLKEVWGGQFQLVGKGNHGKMTNPGPVTMHVATRLKNTVTTVTRSPGLLTLTSLFTTLSSPSSASTSGT